MKSTSLVFACLFALVATTTHAQLFFDGFETDLSAWEANKSGYIAADPLDGTNSVLTFAAANNTFDLRSGPIYLDYEQTYVFSFRYLGLPGPQSVPDNLGGVVGISSTPGIGDGYTWDTTPCEVAYQGDLIDDGAWHSYELTFSLADLGANPGVPIYIMLEDWDGAASACPPNETVGDVFFDDILLVLDGTIPSAEDTWSGFKATYR